jgi:diketogulonate reductase-like aldo/keto reductase
MVVLRWDLQRGVLTIPKSASEHILKRMQKYSISTNREEMSQINSLDCNLRYGYDPMLV